MAYQAPLSMGFSRQNTGMGCHALHQGIFPTQGSNLRFLHLLHWRQVLCHLCHLESPWILQFFYTKRNYDIVEDLDI